jgi:hypothetical protein
VRYAPHHFVTRQVRTGVELLPQVRDGEVAGVATDHVPQLRRLLAGWASEEGRRLVTFDEIEYLCQWRLQIQVGLVTNDGISSALASAIYN